MHEFFRYLRRHLPLLAWLALAAVATPVPAAITPQEATAQKKLTAVKAEIAALAKQQRQTGAQRDDLNARLAAQADALQAAAREVRRSDAAIAANQEHLDALEQQRSDIRQRLEGQRAALADLLRAAYKLGHGTDLRLLLGDEDVARIARALAYSRYFQRDRIHRIRQLLDDLTELDKVERQIATERAKLQAARDQRAQKARQLAAERQRQRTLLAQTRARLQDQQQRMQQLKHDQKALDHLLRQLRDVFADIPKALPADTPFAQLRGKLPWPAAGKVRDSGDGVRIDAAGGSEVRAVAHGRVAYADWLRGYGMLVIIDHGNGWMSLYGDNEAVLHGVGDWVDAGDPIGTASAGSGRAAGVYFELRHDGKPVDPLPWLGKRPSGS